MSIKLASLDEISKVGISEDLALEILNLEESYFLRDILPISKRLRELTCGHEVSLCSIVNAKSGACAEDCAFCTQSAHFKDAVSPVYPMLSIEEIVAQARLAKEAGANEFSIVSSGRALMRRQELETTQNAIRQIREQTGMETCASLGLADRDTLMALKEAGLTHYHHNIETARSFSPNIVTTHSWEEEVQTVLLAKELGLQVCCGGILGMGESRQQRIEFMSELKEIDPDSVPLNFLNPRPGTPLEDRSDLTPLDCLKAIAVARLMMPNKGIFVCGGREFNLGAMQDMIFDAGANGTMLGNYLTTPGREAAEDIVRIKAQGLSIRK